MFGVGGVGAVGFVRAHFLAEDIAGGKVIGHLKLVAAAQGLDLELAVLAAELDAVEALLGQLLGDLGLGRLGIREGRAGKDQRGGQGDVFAHLRLHLGWVGVPGRPARGSAKHRWRRLRHSPQGRETQA